jgi:hypothetical protein
MSQVNSAIVYALNKDRPRTLRRASPARTLLSNVRLCPLSSEATASTSTVRFIEIVLVTYRVYTERRAELDHLTCISFRIEKPFGTLCSS